MDGIIKSEKIQEVEKSDSDIKYIQMGNITFEVVCNYVGKQSMLDIIKAGIRRDIENGNY
jgi:hypothetical protein